MDALGLDGIVLHELVFLLLTLGEVFDMLGVGKLRRDVGEHEELGVVRLARKFVDTLVGEFHAAVFLVNHEVERVGHLWHLALVVLKIVCFGFKHEVFHALLREEFDEGAVFGEALEGAVEQECAFLAHFLVVGCYFCLGFGEDFGDEPALCLYHFLYVGAVFVKELVVALGHGAGDDKRGSRVVDKH